MAVKACYHHVDSTQARSGASHYYWQVGQLLRNAPGEDIDAVPHDIFEILAWPAAEQATWSSALGAADVVVCSLGPYAHLYHCLREKHKGRFRIIREVQTSAWAGYLHQEALCAPYTQPGDVVLFPSEFCRQLFLKLFPQSLSSGNTAISYPLLPFFPAELPQRDRSKVLRLGYIGRISSDKNFEQVLSVFCALARDGEKDAVLHLAGAFDHGTGLRNIGDVVGYLKKRGIASDRIVYHGHVPYSRIWTFFAAVDVFLFPAVSSVESLARVLVEAQHAGVPAIAAHYAAAPELVPHENLAEVGFSFDSSFSSLDVFSFGTVEESGCVKAIRAASAVRRAEPDGPYGARAYFRLVAGAERGAAPAPLTAPVRAFVEALEIMGLEAGASVEGPSLLESQSNFFSEFGDNRLLNRMRLALKSLRLPESFPVRRRLYLSRLLSPAMRMEPVYAREHAWHARFNPTVKLSSGAYHDAR
jgi:glycosyltransferase involved in cell wall biosynthesis